MANSTQYVGRVGGLAVALGIGAAVVGGAGVAWAETPDSPGSAAESGPPGTAPDSVADPAGPASGPADSHSPRGQWRKRPPRTSLTTSSGTLRLPGTPVTGERRKAKSDHRDPKWRKADAGPAAHGNGSAGSGSASPDPVAEAATAAGAPAVRSGAGSPDPGRSRFVRVDAPSRRDGLRSRFNGVADSEGSDTATVTSGSPRPEHGRESVDARESDRGTTESPRLAVLDSKVSPATTPVAAAPPMLRAQAKSAAPTNIVTRLLAPLGIGTRAADNPAKPLEASSLTGLLQLVRRELERVFDNKTPTFTYDSSENVAANGAITGHVVASDPDSTGLTYAASAPAEGEVEIGPDGTFVYTPNADYDGSDSFTVTVSDAAGDFHIHGLSGLVNLLTFGLVGDSGHAYSQTVTVSGVVPPPDVERTVVASGLNAPTDFRFLPDDPNDPNDPEGRILIAEKGGAIKVYNGTQVQSEPVLTLTPQTGWARGLNGIEVDPEFYDNGYVYVSYIDADNYERLSRFTVTDPKAATLTIDPASEKVLLQGDEAAGDDHHGGEVRYVDGKLLWAVGDNVCCSVIDGSNSQDLSNIYGKVLRINPDGTVPADNPFYDTPGARQEIYATGFRNPFRGGVTPDGQLVLGDVGQGTWEEIDLVAAGHNYGWPGAEGVCPGSGVCQSGSAGTTNPIYTYNHDGSSSSITSVLVYDGEAFGARYDNAIFFADFNKGWIKVVNCDAGYTSCGPARTFLPQAGNTTQLMQGPDGSIYQLTLDGTLWRITPAEPTITV